MIMRLFWVVLGAVIGIGGYRRVSRAARMLLPNGGLVGQVGGRATRPALARPASTTLTRRPSRRSAAAGIAAFVRDVRTGMADYLDRHRDI
jgi:hypothetical protein